MQHENPDTMHQRKQIGEDTSAHRSRGCSVGLFVTDKYDYKNPVMRTAFGVPSTSVPDVLAQIQALFDSEKNPALRDILPCEVDGGGYIEVRIHIDRPSKQAAAPQGISANHPARL